MTDDTIHYDCCPLCHGSHLTHYLNTTDHQASGRQFEIVKCHCCGLLFTQDAPAPDTIGQYYASDNYLPHNNGRGFVSLVYRVVRSMMFHKKNALICRHQQHKGTLIDVGAGSGDFMAYMRRKGWNVKGCEQSEQARHEAWRRCKMRLDGDVMTIQYPSASADVITAWHAIEHIHDQQSLWQRFHAWLKPDGLLVVAVPNCDSVDAHYYGSRWAAWDVPRHLWHFSIDTMTQLAVSHGFKLIDIKPLPLDVFYISLMSDQSGVKALVNSFRFTAQVLSNSKQASSLIYFFKKVL